MEGARHTSCTVEMVGVSSTYDVAVVDECQLIGDRCALRLAFGLVVCLFVLVFGFALEGCLTDHPHDHGSERGHAWTRAILGLPAVEVGSAVSGRSAQQPQPKKKQKNRSLIHSTSLHNPAHSAPPLRLPRLPGPHPGAGPANGRRRRGPAVRAAGPPDARAPPRQGLGPGHPGRRLRRGLLAAAALPAQERDRSGHGPAHALLRHLRRPAARGPPRAGAALQRSVRRFRIQCLFFFFFFFFWIFHSCAASPMTPPPPKKNKQTNRRAQRLRRVGGERRRGPGAEPQHRPHHLPLDREV